MIIDINCCLCCILTITVCYFSVWPAKEGPRRDAYNISDNPQFRLELRAPQPSAVWILLTRHITDKVNAIQSIKPNNLKPLDVMISVSSNRVLYNKPF